MAEEDVGLEEQDVADSSPDVDNDPAPPSPGGVVSTEPDYDNAGIRHRISQATESGYRRAQQEAAEQAATLKAQIQLRDNQLRAMAGLEPKAPERSEEDQAVIKRLSGLVPGLDKLGNLDDRFGKIEEALSQTQRLHQSAQAQHFDRLADNAIAQLEEGYKAHNGGVTPNARAASQVKGLFIQFLAGNPEQKQAYEMGRSSVFDAFWTDMQSGLLAGARQRAGTETVTRRKPQPRAGASRTLATTPKDADKEETMDELLDAAWEQKQAAKAQ